MRQSERILRAIGNIDDEIIINVGRKQGFLYAKKSTKRPPRRLGRILLLAATLATLFVGSAYAAGWFGLASRMVKAENPYTVEADENAETMSETGGWVAANGDADSPEAQASLEWARAEWEFRQEHVDWNAADDWVAAQGERKPACEIYNCFNQEMLDKLYEICSTYGLRLHEEVAYPMTETQFEQAAGIGKFLQSENGSWTGHYIYEDGSFKGEGIVELDGGGVVYQLNRSRSGVLAPYGMYVLAPESYDEWQYTVHGHTLNLALKQGDYGFEGIVFFHEGEDFITINYSARYIPGTPADFDRSNAEALAGCFDYDALCGGKSNLNAINALSIVAAKPKAGLLTSAEFAKTPEYLAGSAFHTAYNDWNDMRQNEEWFVKGQYWQYYYAPFPTGVKELDAVFQEIRENYVLRYPATARAIVFGEWIGAERMTSLLSYRMDEGPEKEKSQQATADDYWKLIGMDDFLLNGESKLLTAVQWDNGAWQVLIGYGSTSYQLTYVPKGSFCPVVRQMLHPEAEGWAYETACGEQVYITLDGEMEYPRFQTQFALYETDTAYVMIGPDGTGDAATMQLYVDNIDLTKFM